MKKIIIGVFAIALLASSVAYAERGPRLKRDDDRMATSTRSELRDRNATSTRENLKGTKNVDATCVSAAVLVREDANQTAWQKFSDSVDAMLTARKTALSDAWALTDAKARKEAVKKAWDSTKSTKKSANETYKNAKKSAWATFKTSAKACGGSDGTEAFGDKEPVEKLEI